MKPKLIKKYKTYNLDEAAYYILMGMRWDAEAVERAALFIFEDDEKLESLRTAFFSSDVCFVNLHKWISTRQMIKNGLKSKLMVDSSVSYGDMIKKTISSKKRITQLASKPLNTYTPKKGEPYWYISNGTIQHAVSGSNEMHAERIRSNNSFQTQEEAKVALARWFNSQNIT